VSTAAKGKEGVPAGESLVLPELELPVKGIPPAKSELFDKSGIKAGKLIEQGPGSWIYDGDLRPALPVRVLTGLIVRGDCILPDGSVIEGDIKSKANLSLGARSVCRGNAIAEGDLTVGASATFHGVLHSGGTLRIHAGARGGDPEAHVAAYAAGNLLLSGDVIVHGKLAAGENVIVNP
jgi:hypothetical protein